MTTPDYAKCRFCKAWFIKGEHTVTRKKGKRFIHETTCPRCGNVPYVEHSFSPTPKKTNYAPQMEVEIWE